MVAINDHCDSALCIIPNCRHRPRPTLAGAGFALLKSRYMDSSNSHPEHSRDNRTTGQASAPAGPAQPLRQRASVRLKIGRALAVGHVRWVMLALIFFATTLNYVDRAALGVLQPALAGAMHWTSLDYANINFWFQVGYALGYVVQGRLVDMFGVKRSFAVAILFWSAAMAAHGFAISAAGFMLCRFILGLAEAASYPSCIKVAQRWFPSGERALAAGIFNGGTNVGAMLTPLLIPISLSVWGWPSVFFALGAVGLVLFVLWLMHYHDPEQHPGVGIAELNYIQSSHDADATALPWRKVLTMRATWAYLGAYMLTSPIFIFYVFWLPPYLNTQFHLDGSVVKLGLPLVLIYLAADFASIGGGALSSWMIARGFTPVRARLLSMNLFAVCILPLLFASSASGLWATVGFLALAIGAHQAWTANIWGLAMDILPRNAISSVYGIGGFLAAVGGMLMTKTVGYLLTATDDNYSLLFVMIPGAYFVALIWLYMMVTPKLASRR